MKTLLVAGIFALNLFSQPLAADDEKSLGEAQNEPGMVRLDSQAQRLSGIETIKPKPTSHHAEFSAYGKAINIQALLSLRNRYLLALTERSIAVARHRQAEQNISRQQQLYGLGVSSKRNLQEQQAQWQTYKAQVDATKFQELAIIDEAMLMWGKPLADLAMASDSGKLDTLLSGQTKLLQITLPSNKHLSKSVSGIMVDASGNRSKAYPAKLISIAAQTEAGAQGESYYFQTEGKNIIPGMNITAWIPEQDAQITGVLVPKSALVWYIGLAFVYVKTSEETFARQTVTDYFVLADGYFIPRTDIKPDQEIVSKGAQLLLSEELLGQIPSEDDD
ncbi:MAG: hypothetical protein NTV43_04385 [Methylococcales bacterium]|nr:hypothetical protein [Methylococcales bacterium]